MDIILPKNGGRLFILIRYITLEKNSNIGNTHVNAIDASSYYFEKKIHERYIYFLSISKEVFINFQKEHDGAILNFAELDFFIQDQERPDNYKSILSRLDIIREVLRFQNHQNHDPIVWIAYLYYFEEMSVAAISRVLQEFNIVWKTQALSHFLKNTLSWSMRDNTHITKDGKDALSYLSVFRDRVDGVFVSQNEKQAIKD
jgi:hypothetical protein